MHRKDNETLFDWSTRVQKCQAGITEHGHGWEAIGTGEAVAKLWEWLGYDEKQVAQEYYRTRATTRYPTVKSLLYSEELDELVTTLNRRIGSILDQVKKSWYFSFLKI